jgi:hypothetical protein
LLRLLCMRNRSGRNAGNYGQGDYHQRLANHNSPPENTAYWMSPAYSNQCDYRGYSA